MDYQTIQLPDFLSVIQLLDHSAFGQLLAIQLPDMSNNRMPTVFSLVLKLWLEYQTIFQLATILVCQLKVWYSSHGFNSAHYSCVVSEL